MYDNKLSGLGHGLIKIKYDYAGQPLEELAMIVTPYLTKHINLPNNSLCYRTFLRECMKAQVTRGIKPIGPISAPEIKDEFIESIDGRVIMLNDTFGNFKINYNQLLVGCNNPHYSQTVLEISRTLRTAQFDVHKNNWDDYKAWEIEKLKTF